MERIQTYQKIAQELRTNYPNITEFETLSLAIQIQRNQILESGLNVSPNDKYPSALEAIAMALGYSDTPFVSTITDVLREIKDQQK